MTNHVKPRLYNVVTKPALRYCSEMWVLREEENRRLKISQTRFNCNMLGVTFRDRMRSEDIRKQLKMKQIDKYIREYQKKWMQHLEQMKKKTECTKL
jgi:hypothetical protein